MKTVTTTPELLHSTTESNSHLFDDWFDPIESGIRDRVRELIEEMICSELDAVLSPPRSGRRAKPAGGADVVAGVAGHRHGNRLRTLMGTLGKTEIAVPSARLAARTSRDRHVAPRQQRHPRSGSLAPVEFEQGIGLA